MLGYTDDGTMPGQYLKRTEYIHTYPIHWYPSVRGCSLIPTFSFIFEKLNYKHIQCSFTLKCMHSINARQLTLALVFENAVAAAYMYFIFSSSC